MGIVAKLHFKQDCPFIQNIQRLPKPQPPIEGIAWQMDPTQYHITLIHLKDTYKDSKPQQEITAIQQEMRATFVRAFNEMVEAVVRQFHSFHPNLTIQNATASSGQQHTNLRINFYCPEAILLQEIIKNNTASLLQQYPQTGFTVSPTISLHISIANINPPSQQVAGAAMPQMADVSYLNNTKMAFQRLEIGGVAFSGCGENEEIDLEPRWLAPQFSMVQPYAQSSSSNGSQSQPVQPSQGVNGALKPFFKRDNNSQVIFMTGTHTKDSLVNGVTPFGATPANTAFIFASNSDHHRRSSNNKSLPVIGNKKVNSSAITVTTGDGGIATLAYSLQEEAGFQIGGIPNTRLDLYGENPVLLVLATMKQIDDWLAVDGRRHIILPVRIHRNQAYFTQPCFDNLEPSWFGGRNTAQDPVTAFLIRLYFMEKAGLAISTLEKNQRELLEHVNKIYFKKANMVLNLAIVNAPSQQEIDNIGASFVLTEDDFFDLDENDSGPSSSGPSSPLGQSSFSGQSSPSNLARPQYTCRGCSPGAYRGERLLENQIIYFANNNTQEISYKYAFKDKVFFLTISAAELGVGGVTKEYAGAIKTALEQKVNARGFIQLEALKHYITERAAKGFSFFDTLGGGVDGRTKIFVATAILNHVEKGIPLNEIPPEGIKALNERGSDLQKAIIDLGQAIGRDFVAEINALYANLSKGKPPTNG